MRSDPDDLQQWIGRSETREERIGAFPSNALAATLNRNDPPYKDGSPLPPLWHWLHFLPISPLHEAGPDGHPAGGTFLPPVPLPRRMWAGSRLVFQKPLFVGELGQRISTVTKIEHKSGRSGKLIFVTVRHEVKGESGLAIEEEHDIVYRGAASPGSASPLPVAPPPADSKWTFAIAPDPVLLFRYSALTFNSHRIHYDLDYATRDEGYPGLVVHGPLIATLLLDGMRRARPEACVTRFSFRAVAPIFHVDSFTVHGKQRALGKAQLWAEKQGALAMDGEAEFC